MSSIPTNTKNTENPYKKDIFETYIIWKSIPAFLKRVFPEIAGKLGIDEDLLIELMNLRTQTEFAEKYEIEGSTLSNWNKLIEKRKILDDMRSWAKGLTKNVVGALYRKSIQTGDANIALLWFKFIEGWSEKGIETQREYTPVKITVTDPRGNVLSKL